MLSNLLFDKHPLMINRKLAKIFNLETAIVIQQIHYWITHNKQYNQAETYIDGCYWVYSSISEWLQRDFSFISERTLYRIISNLKKQGILIVKKLSNDKTNRKNWYTLSYTILQKIVCQNGRKDSAKMAGSILPNWQDVYNDKETNKETNNHHQESISNNLNNSTTKTPKKADVDDDVFKLLTSYGVSLTSANLFAAKFSLEFTQHCIKKVNAEFKAGKIKNFCAYLVKVLQQSNGIIPNHELQAIKNEQKKQNKQKQQANWQKFKKQVSIAVENNNKQAIKTAKQYYKHICADDNLNAEFEEFMYKMGHLDAIPDGIQSKVIQKGVLIFQKHIKNKQTAKQ